MTKKLSAACLFLFLHGSAEAASCPKASWEQIKQSILTQSPRTTSAQLVFFSPWCGECKNHMKNESGLTKVFINTFDEETRGAAVMEKYGIKHPCFTDVDLSTLFRVKMLPTVKDIDLTRSENSDKALSLK